MALMAATAALLAPQWSHAGAIVLDPLNPLGSFMMESAKNPADVSFTPGLPLLVSDSVADDLITFYAAAPFAALGFSVDLIVNFRVQPGETRQGADSGLRFVINDGLAAAYFAAIVKNGVKGIGIASGTDFGSEENYLSSSFFQVDWTNPNPTTADGRVTLHLRRSADGSAEIVEVNGVAPSTPVQLVRGALPGPQRPRGGPTIEFGMSNLEAIGVVEITEFRAFTTPISEPEIYAMLGVGLGLMGWVGRRRKAQPWGQRSRGVTHTRIPAAVCLIVTGTSMRRARSARRTARTRSPRCRISRGRRPAGWGNSGCP